MAGLGNDSLVRKVLSDPSQYPDEFQSWIQRLIPGNPLIQLDHTQIPQLEAVHEVGATNQPVYQHGSAFGAGSQHPGYWKDPLGVVNLRGVVGATYAAGQTIFQLPSGYRPVVKEFFACISDTGIARVDVDELGNVIFVSGGVTYVSLSGITFRAF